MKKTALLLIAILCITTIISCGPSQEKIDKVQTKYAELVALHNDVVDLCAILEIYEDDTIGPAINEIADLLNSIKDEELNQYSNDELDGFISDLNEAIEAMSSLKAVLQNEVAG